MLDADAGGYAENVASAEGLAEITELNEYRYMTALDPGESADVYVTLTLDGEGMDSADGIDYCTQPVRWNLNSGRTMQTTESRWWSQIM